VSAIMKVEAAEFCYMRGNKKFTLPGLINKYLAEPDAVLQA